MPWLDDIGGVFPVGWKFGKVHEIILTFAENANISSIRLECRRLCAMDYNARV